MKLTSPYGLHYLPFYLAIFDFNGNLLDFRILGTELHLCPSSVNDGLNQRAFGYNFVNSCKQNL